MSKNPKKQCFDWKSYCFFCAKPADKKWSTVSRVENLPAVNLLIGYCETKGAKWGKKFLHHLLYCNGLVAEETVSQRVHDDFQMAIHSDKRCGCPIDLIMMNNFKCVCNWLEDEADSELYTLSTE